MYGILMSSFPVMDTMKVIWERHLGSVFSDTQWNRVKKFNQAFSANVIVRDNRFKTLNRWHFSPLKLGKMYPHLSDNCWKCSQEGVDFFSHVVRLFQSFSY